MNKLTIRKPHKPPHVENKQPPFFWESQQFGAYSVAYKQQFCRIETNNRTFFALCYQVFYRIKLSLQHQNKRIMETITVRYDATNPALRALMAAFLKLDGVTKVKTAKTTEPDYAKEIARRAAGVKSGKIKTRPVEELLSEA